MLSSVKLCFLLLLSLALIQGSFVAGTEIDGSTTDASVLKFLERVDRALHSENKDIISGLFTASFVFQKCDGSSNKTYLVNALSNLNPSTQYSFEMKSAKVVNTDIEFVVSIKDFGKCVMTVEATLNKTTQRLEKAKQLNCKQEYEKL